MLDGVVPPVIRYDDAVRSPSLAVFPLLPFNHPLFILFSSGTTGAPKCIVHGAGGTLLEHLKEHRLHCNLAPDDKLYFPHVRRMDDVELAAQCAGHGLRDRAL